MKFKTHFTYIGFGLLVLILSGCSLLPEKTVDEKSVPSVVQEQTKEYRSEFMKISLQIPVDWVVEEDSTYIDLISREGLINISRNSTNWDNLDGFLSEIDLRRPTEIVDSKKIKIVDFNAIVRIENFDVGPISGHKVYYIYINGWVFTLSTSTPELYDDLDQIAQSFQYFGK